MPVGHHSRLPRDIIFPCHAVIGLPRPDHVRKALRASGSARQEESGSLQTTHHHPNLRPPDI